MKWFRKRKQPESEGSGGPVTRFESLSYRPVKNSEVQEKRSENGEVLLTYPLILKPWFMHLAGRLGLRSAEPLTRKLQLDEMGSLTWTLLNGERTVQDTIEHLCYKYNLNRRETEIAVTGFLRQLGKRGIIGFRPPPNENQEESS
jgi:hypothetical protein